MKTQNRKLDNGQALREGNSYLNNGQKMHDSEGEEHVRGNILVLLSIMLSFETLLTLLTEKWSFFCCIDYDILHCLETLQKAVDINSNPWKHDRSILCDDLDYFFTVVLGVHF